MKLDRVLGQIDEFARLADPIWDLFVFVPADERRDWMLRWSIPADTGSPVDSRGRSRDRMADAMSQITFVVEPALRNLCVPIATNITRFRRFRSHGSRVLNPEAFVLQREQAGPEVYFVLVGRNDATAPFVDAVTPSYEKHGVVWGFDGNQASIRVVTPAPDLDVVRNEIKTLERDARNHPDNLGAVVVLRLFDSDPYWRIPAPSRAQMGQWAASPFLARERIREAQLRLGLLSFVSDGIVPFAGLPTMGF
ncbi:MAG: hypothetical protein QGH45_06190 [Myxococcota bacterium]|nr:hypothetical protein [Myxococcota bacterium]